MRVRLLQSPCLRLAKALAVLALLTAGAATAATPANGGLTLASGGATDYRIVPTGSGNAMDEHAARELADYLKRSTGARFRQTDHPGGGPTIRLRVQPGSDLPGEGFRLRSAGGNLTITGGSHRGLLYGVYTFLERYVGVRWYGPDYTVVPHRDPLTVPPLNLTDAPAVAYREAFIREADDPAYSAHNRLNGRFGHRIAKHMGTRPDTFDKLRKLNIFQLVPKSRYGSEHPAYFGGGQLRFANPDVRRTAIAAVRRKLEQWSAPPRYLLIEHADRDTYFRGGHDGALIDRYGSPGAAYIDFVRAIARAVEPDFPDTTVLAQAYKWSRPPVSGMSLPSNMGIMFSDIERDFGEPLSARVNAPLERDLQGWRRLTDHVLLWTYVTDFAGYLQPFPDLDTFAPDLRLGSAPLEGVFAEGAYNTTGSEFAVLRSWVLAHLMWDPDRDPQALIKDFLSGYYGAAAPQIRAYIELLQDSEARWHGLLGDKTPPTAGYLDASTLSRAERLFDAAEDAVASDPAQLRHVRIARMSVDYALLAQPADGGDATDGRETRLSRLQSTMKAAGMTAYREGRGHPPSELIEALRIQRHYAKAPAICHGRPAAGCRSVQDLSLDLAGDAGFVADRAASDGAAVRENGASDAWAVQLPLDRLLPDSGEWRLYAAVRAEGDDDGKALRAGVYPGRRVSVGYSKLAAGDYRLVALPGRWTGTGERYLWVSATGRGGDRDVYIDRIVAVREDSP